MSKSIWPMTNWVIETNVLVNTKPNNEQSLIDNVYSEILTMVEERDNNQLVKCANDCPMHENDVYSRSLSSENIEYKSEKLESLYSLAEKEEIVKKRFTSFTHYPENTQIWKGIIIGILDKEVKAKMIDLSDPTTYEIGTFDVNQFSDSADIVEGKVFYYSIGKTNVSGQIKTEAILRPQKIIHINPQEFDRISDLSKESPIRWK